MPRLNRRRLPRRLIHAGLALTGVGLLSAVPVAAAPKAPAPVDCVNPMVGTDAHGHTYPGATLPFGFVQLSPDTPLQGWDGSSGYHYSDTTILGFSHTHLSGTGVGGLGDILLMPTVGDVRLNAGTPGAGDGYSSRFSHTQETASPGYYKVYLQDPKVTAELTATERCGLHRYTFPQSDAAHIVLDLAHGVGNDPINETLTVENNSTLSGSRLSNGWGGHRTVFFVLQFSKPFDALGIEQDGTRLPAGAASAAGKSVKAFANYRTAAGEAVLVRVGLSGTSVEGARKNLAAEMPGFDFNAVHTAAVKQWSRALDVVQVSAISPEVRRTFYTNLYETMLSPVLYNDVNGAYLGLDKKIHAGSFQNYTTFSLWDTFRAQNPLLTLVQPERMGDITHSLLSEFQESHTNRMPIWPLYDNETYTMIGYHSAPVIADAYLKGLAPANAEAEYQALKTTAMQDVDGLGDYKSAGYVFSAGNKQSVSRTLEYAYDDWCIAQMASKLGHADDAQMFLKRSANYRNVFDTNTGFMRGRKADGTWRGPFNPKMLVWDDYTEANAWQYTWSVMQDVPGLVSIMGGDTAFVNKLDGLFDAKSDVISNIPDITGLIGQYAHGNEPVHHVAYLYSYAGAPYKTQARARQVMNTLYNDTPAGQCGNNDCGQMSAWYVFSALGFYPVSPVSGVYVLGSPLVSRATIQLDKAHYGGKTFTLIADNNSAKNIYIQSATLNGKPLTRSYFTQSELAGGGTLHLTMGAAPNKTWGLAPASRPPSGLPAGLTLAALPAPSTAYKPVLLSVPIRVICGTDIAAGNFIPDPNMQDGSVNGAPAAVDVSAPNAAPLAVYQSERYGSDFTYTFPVPKGRAYTVRLHFAEIFGDGAGQRVENIEINDKTVLPNFDTFAAAGGANKAVVKQFDNITPDAGGVISIRITAVKGSPDQNAKISGIEILPAPGVAAR